MRFRAAHLIIFGLAMPTLAQGPPPIPCADAIISPSQVVVTFQGLTSGCSEQGGTCIVGETVIFTASTTNLCVLSDFWQFPGEPVVAGTTVNHVFTTPGSFTVTLTAAGPNNSVQVSKTVAVAPASAIPTLGTFATVVVLLSLAFIAARRLA